VRLRGQLSIASAALAWSLAGVLQRGLHVTTATQIAGRAFFAALTLIAICLVEARRAGDGLWRFSRAIGWTGIAMAICMAGANASFVTALNHASVASVLFIQALAPFVAVVLARLFLGEVATRRTWVATIVAVGGVGVMVGDRASISWFGLAASVLMTVLFAVAIVLTRRSHHVSMTPAVVLTQLLVLVGSAGFASPGDVRIGDLWRLVVLGVFQMGLAQLLFVVGARLIPASETALLTLLEVVAGPLLVWLFYAENPGRPTLIGGLIVLAAVVYQTTERGPARMPVATPSPT
jgi:RarD protein